MAQGSYVFTSESVSEGHPDKICDLISDTVVDLYLAADSHSRVACETLATTNRVVLAGEVRGPDEVAAGIIDAVRAAIRRVGYEQDGFHWRTCAIETYLHPQSQDIAQGVDAQAGNDSGNVGAGDQGLMFGHACRETDVLMPAAIHYAHAILRDLARARHAGEVPGLGPDSKSQISLRYENSRPIGAASVVVSTQHDPGLGQKQVRELVRPYVERCLPPGWMCPEDEFHVNPTGVFVTGGPDGDTGLTGRKIIVDTYGGAAPHGGGAFSGKDPSKVDRSAAYAARWVAKNLVAAGLADKCTIQVAYAIGHRRPLSVLVETYGTGALDDTELERRVRSVVDLSPGGIRSRLDLGRPIYARTSSYGHFGREPEADGGFSWERLDLVDALRQG